MSRDNLSFVRVWTVPRIFRQEKLSLVREDRNHLGVRDVTSVCWGKYVGWRICQINSK